MARTKNCPFRMVPTSLQESPTWKILSGAARSVWTNLNAQCMSKIVGVAIGASTHFLASITGLTVETIEQAIAELQECREIHCDWDLGIVYMPRVLRDCQPRGVRAFASWGEVWPFIRKCCLHDRIVAEISYLLGEQKNPQVVAEFERIRVESRIQFEGILPPEMAVHFVPISDPKSPPQPGRSTVRKSSAGKMASAKPTGQTPDQNAANTGQNPNISKGIDEVVDGSDGMAVLRNQDKMHSETGASSVQNVHTRYSDTLDTRDNQQPTDQSSDSELTNQQSQKPTPPVVAVNSGSDARARGTEIPLCRPEPKVSPNVWWQTNANAAEKEQVMRVWSAYQQHMAGLVADQQLVADQRVASKILTLLRGKRTAEQLIVAVERIAESARQDESKRGICYPLACFKEGPIAYALDRPEPVAYQRHPGAHASKGFKSRLDMTPEERKRAFNNPQDNHEDYKLPDFYDIFGHDEASKAT